ncbi:secreted seminal-vesicle Ly-6 protein 1-like [Rattus rattus]|uniref:secreted seminal-vesicle Ly-6 protein 1-like n=1 Tax=Rattus rattus TaxID=10117 RepID=UPI0013F32FDF|nr:secreted seminal-vesicle Ly-6 protein 1-like [Rattus rattus]
MGKYLLLLLGIFLLVDFLQALTCVRCGMLNSSRVCVTGETSCEATNNRKCALWLLYKDGKFQHGFQECLETCYNYTKTDKNEIKEYKCCDHQNLCNKL